MEPEITMLHVKTSITKCQQALLLYLRNEIRLSKEKKTLKQTKQQKKVAIKEKKKMET